MLCMLGEPEDILRQPSDATPGCGWQATISRKAKQQRCYDTYIEIIARMPPGDWLIWFSVYSNSTSTHDYYRGKISTLGLLSCCLRKPKVSNKVPHPRLRTEVYVHVLYCDPTIASLTFAWLNKTSKEILIEIYRGATHFHQLFGRLKLKFHINCLVSRRIKC